MSSQPRFAIHELLQRAPRAFSQKQKILVNFLYRNYQKVAFMNITELATETKVSEATIVRLANFLGFDGYPSLQKAVQKIVSQELTTLERMQLSLGQHELDHPMQGALKTDMRNLMRVYQHASAAQVGRVVGMILGAEKIVVAGVMASAPLAHYFGYSLKRSLRHVEYFIEDSLAVKRAVFELGRKDLLIAFAFPRYPASVIQLLKVAEERHAARLGFTDGGSSPVAALANACVYLPSEMLAFVDSLAAPMSFLAGLLAEIVRREPKVTERGLKEFESLAGSFHLFHRDA